jgi:hypothetical protein
VLHSALPYSFVLDNGACYVSTGLLARLEDEPQLAALIAMPLAAVVRHDRQNLGAAGQQSALRSFIPNLLLITATAGLGAPVIEKAHAKARADAQNRAQAASDAVAMNWLAAAGYDPHAASAALRRLRELLAAEQRFGNTEFSDAALLASRADSLEGALAGAGKSAESAAPADTGGNFHRISVYYALALATEDITFHSVGVQPILDRVEASQGPSGYSTFVRAEFMRHDSSDAASVPATIAAYQHCIEHSAHPRPRTGSSAFCTVVPARRRSPGKTLSSTWRARRMPRTPPSCACTWRTHELSRMAPRLARCHCCARHFSRGECTGRTGAPDRRATGILGRLACAGARAMQARGPAAIATSDPSRGRSGGIGSP